MIYIIISINTPLWEKNSHFSFFYHMSGANVSYCEWNETMFHSGMKWSREMLQPSSPFGLRRAESEKAEMKQACRRMKRLFEPWNAPAVHETKPFQTSCFFARDFGKKNGRAFFNYWGNISQTQISCELIENGYSFANLRKYLYLVTSTKREQVLNLNTGRFLKLISKMLPFLALHPRPIS